MLQSTKWLAGKCARMSRAMSLLTPVLCCSRLPRAGSDEHGRAAARGLAFAFVRSMLVRCLLVFAMRFIRNIAERASYCNAFSNLYEQRVPQGHAKGGRHGGIL